MRSATVREQAGHWYVSLQVADEPPVPKHTGPLVGIDLGVKSLARRSDGEVLANPHHRKRRLKTLTRLPPMVSRRQKGGQNRKKAARKLARRQRQIQPHRGKTLQQVTTRRANTTSVLVIEDLNVSGRVTHQQLAQAIGDVGFYAFTRQLR
jgi:putative transposase